MAVVDQEIAKISKDEVRKALKRIHAKKEYHRCSICFEDVDREVEGRSEGAALCLCRSGESV